MFIYTYNNIHTCPNLGGIHADILNALSDKEFDGCLYDKCCHACVPCVHLNCDGKYFDSLDIKFNLELSTSEKTTLDGIIENNL